MKNLFSNLILLFILGSMFVGCQPGTENIEGQLPSPTGSKDEIIVVMDTTLYNGELGGVIKEHLADLYRILPQPEPVYELINIPHFSYKNMFKRYRNVLLVNIDKQYTQTKFRVLKNVNANPQIIIEAQAPNKKMMNKLLSQKAEAILDRFLETERENYISTYKKIADRGITKSIEKKFGISMVVPKGYSIDKDTTNFMWIVQEGRHYSQNILIYEYPYNKSKTFYLGNIKERRNKFTRRYVPGPSPQSYMKIENLVNSMYSEIEINGLEVTEVRGLWKLENDFMGGPFINYSFYNPITEKAVSVDAFVYAPKYDKRNYVSQLEAMLHTVEIAR